MAPLGRLVDDEENIRRFLSVATRGKYKPVETPPVAHSKPSEVTNGSASKHHANSLPRAPLVSIGNRGAVNDLSKDDNDQDSNAANGSAHHDSKPLGVQAKVSDSGNTPHRQTGKGSSPSLHPHPSPSGEGIQPPVNTPRFATTNSHSEDVGDALAIFVQNLDGRPLSDSIWAPKIRSSPLGGDRTPSRNLTPTWLVHPNPAINESFSRMTFRVADLDNRGANNIIGEHNVRPSRYSEGSSSPSPVSVPTKRELTPSNGHDSSPVSVLGLNKTTPTLTFRNGDDEVSPVSGPGPIKSTNTYKIGHDEVIVEDGLGVKAANTSTNGIHEGITESSSPLPPHLRRTAKIRRPTGTVSSNNPEDEGEHTETNHSSDIHPVMQPENAGNHPKPMTMNTVEVPITSPSSPIQQALVSNPTSGVGAMARNVSSSATADQGVVTSDGSGTIDEDFNRLEASGFLSAENVVILQRIRERLSGSEAQETPLDNCLPAKTSKDSAHPDILTKTDENRTSMNATETIDQVPSKACVTGVSRSLQGQTNSKDESIIRPASTTVTPASKAVAGRKISQSILTEDSENRENLNYFTSWGKREVRASPPAKVRTVIIRNLPYQATPQFVAGLVYGGAIEDIHMTTSAAGDLTATVRFVDADQCNQYFEATANGVVYKKDSQNRDEVLYVDIAKDVDVVGGLLRTWIDTGVTRCVRAVGVDKDWGTAALIKLAEGKGRKLEGISDSINPGGVRTVVFRFCRIEDAVPFKAALTRNEDWEQCNIFFAVDPCATATGVHLDG